MLSNCTTQGKSGCVVSMIATPRLIVATRNTHKTAEIRALLGEKFQVCDVSEFPELPEIEETGSTFLENARLKALGISSRIEGWVLSDDSGLEVDALAGAPGVWSSSYGGEEGNHWKNNARLLVEMLGMANRVARFHCTVVIALGGAERAHFSGKVEGRIIEACEGERGFGYDPLFIPEGHQQTFAQLGDTIKNTLSHRARALAQVLNYFEGVLEGDKGISNVRD